MLNSSMAADRPDKLPLEVFESLPKTDLHVHLDGSLRLETILELAAKRSVELPSTDPGRAPAHHAPRRELRLARRVPQGVRRHALG